MTRPDATLPELLHERAVESAPRRLGLDVVGGAFVAASAMWFRPKGWVAIASAGVCFVAYGVWAVSERSFQAHDTDTPLPHARAWRVARLVSASVGVASVVLLLFTLLGMTLGTWIS